MLVLSFVFTHFLRFDKHCLMKRKILDKTLINKRKRLAKLNIKFTEKRDLQNHLGFLHDSRTV